MGEGEGEEVGMRDGVEGCHPVMSVLKTKAVCGALLYCAQASCGDAEHAKSERHCIALVICAHYFFQDKVPLPT